MVVSSNRESGHGRYGIRVEFRDLKKVVLFEFKRSEDEKELESDAFDGLAQAKKNKYVSDLRESQCLLIGVSFIQKEMSALKCGIIQN